MRLYHTNKITLNNNIPQNQNTQITFTNNTPDKITQDFQNTLGSEDPNNSNAHVDRSVKKPVLLWLSVSENNESRWVDLNRQSYYLVEIDKAAKRYGVPIVLPMFDNRDNDIVTAQGIVKDDVALIQKTSGRYNNDTIWIGKITKQPSGSWNGRWTVIHNNKIVHNWENAEPSVETLISGGTQVFSKELPLILNRHINDPASTPNTPLQASPQEKPKVQANSQDNVKEVTDKTKPRRN